MLLLNPGPVTLTANVRNALTRADICHREPEFAVLQADVRRRLTAVYELDPARWAATLLTGSGTAAVEAMISTLPAARARVLVVANGVYGERMRAMAEASGIDCVKHELSWGEAIDARALSNRMEATQPTHVAVVHHETTTGRLNDLEMIGACARAHDARLLIDGVSSFGAEAIDFEGLPIDAVAATANKCLHGAPGAAFVIVRRDALMRAQPRSVYLDLVNQTAKQDADATAFTPSIPVYYALAAALVEHAHEGGWQVRRERYRTLARQVADGCAQHEIDPLLAADESSCVLRAYRLPQRVSYTELHDHLKAAGFVIYAGQGALAETIFRISTMGAITEGDVSRLIDAIAAVANP